MGVFFFSFWAPNFSGVSANARIEKKVERRGKNPLRYSNTCCLRDHRVHKLRMLPRVWCRLGCPPICGLDHGNQFPFLLTRMINKSRISTSVKLPVTLFAGSNTLVLLATARNGNYIFNSSSSCQRIF